MVVAATLRILDLQILEYWDEVTNKILLLVLI